MIYQYGKLNFMGTLIPMTRLRMCAERRFFTFMSYVIFVHLWLKRWLTLFLALLFSHESTTLIHCIQECHLLILTNCSWCRTHLHALLLSSENWTTSSHRSRDCSGYRSVNVSISRLHGWYTQFVILVNLNIWIRCWWTINKLDLYGLRRTFTSCSTDKIIFHFSSFQCYCTKTLV